MTRDFISSRRAEFTNHVILSAVRTTRSEVLTESKDPLPLSAKIDAERHFDNGSMGRTPCRAGADVKLQGVLRLRWIIRKTNDPTSLRMTWFLSTVFGCDHAIAAHYFFKRNGSGASRAHCLQPFLGEVDVFQVIQMLEDASRA
jgi:hypothetical protein